MAILYRITTGYACFGIVVEAGRVILAAPIARWARGKPWEGVRAYYERRGAVVEALG